MIHFGCEHCGESVRVDDSHAGKSGRCPFCREVVRIPEQSTRRSQNVPVDQTPPRSDVPPPPSVSEGADLEDEMNMVEVSKDPASETDIIPAANDEDEQSEALDVGNHLGDDQPASPADQALPRPVPGVPARPAGKPSARGIRLLLWACVIAGVLAVLGALAYVIAGN
jgi:hypothetical protein